MLIDPFFFFTFDIVFGDLFNFLGTVLSSKSFLFVPEDLSLPAKIDLLIVVDDLQVCFLQLTLKNSVRKLIFFKFQ